MKRKLKPRRNRYSKRVLTRWHPIELMFMVAHKRLHDRLRKQYAVKKDFDFTQPRFMYHGLNEMG